MKHEPLDPPSDSPETGSTTTDATSLAPVPVRARHDGWTPGRQRDFIAALAACGCVADAAAHVGMSARSAYKLRARPAARSFREAWDVALDHAVACLADAVFSRALNGVARPVFYQGEQVGERRFYDERLAMFILSRRAPERFGRWIDQREVRENDDAMGEALGEALDRVAKDAALPDGKSPPERGRLPTRKYLKHDEAGHDYIPPRIIPTAEDTDRAILKRIANLKRHRAKQAAEEAGETFDEQRWRNQCQEAQWYEDPDEPE